MQTQNNDYTDKLGCADALLKILESNKVKHIFGHPGEQILPFYEALRKSNLKHILMRHEQGAVHAADAYSRVSSNFGVCVSTAGPGAMNLVMGVAAAFKDSVPMIVITGDVPRHLKGKNVLQNMDLNAVFEPITLKTFYIENAEQGVQKLKYALELIQKNKTGPVHLNFPKDVLEEQVDIEVINKSIEYPFKSLLDEMGDAKKLIEKCNRPLILAGAGIIWAHAVSELRDFAERNSIPVATTYPARGVLSEDHPLCLGMIGIRGTDAANFAGKNSDLILALGCKFSENTKIGVGKGSIIHVNPDENILYGDLKIQGDALTFLQQLNSIKIKNTVKWLSEIGKYRRSYDIKTSYEELPIKPQRAIKDILDASENSITVTDAGTLTIWITLLKKVIEPSSLIFSGGFGPMGYGLPAAIGAALAAPDRKIVLITGDGGFQMTMQELAVIAQENIPILICIINNCCLGLIKQWQDIQYSEQFEVELENPDFVAIAKAYGIESKRIELADNIYKTVQKAIKSNKPFLMEIMVDPQEKIPLPQNLI